ncbi:MAG TPA: hydrogenase maturation protease [Bacteroidales bacterium]|nr:hydrogenase maturation protease [Bacteroidales bacterium]
MKLKLEDILKRKDKNILLAGVGNVLRSDDGVGVFIVSGIKPSGHISTILVEVSIENYIPKINSLSPDILIIADCVDFNRQPGYADIIPVGQVNEFNISSHNISLKRVSEFLKMEVYVLGIQPDDLRVGEYLTPVVKASAAGIIEIINEIIG